MDLLSQGLVENISVFKTHKATCGVVNSYSAGVVTHDRRIGSWLHSICSVGPEDWQIEAVHFYSASKLSI
jgi:hypothetical protein